MAASPASSYYDFSDKLNFYWTSLILLLFVSLVGVLRYFVLGSLISCWTPVHFTTQMAKYTHTICWEQDVTYLPGDDPTVPHDEYGPTSIPTFHTWIPVVLICMMLGFQIPRAVKLLFDSLLRNSTSTISDNDSQASNTENAEQLAQIIRESQNQSSFIRTLSFIIVKLLICLNVLVQFIFVSRYFQDSVHEVTDTENITTTITTEIFPKMVLCDYQIRQLSNVKHFTMQCNMPVNYLYEQFIHILWYWIFGTGFVTGIVFVAQLASLLFTPLVRLRFRGIIPEKELNRRGFSVDDSLLMLLDIENSSGLTMARKVAAILVESEQSSLNHGPKGYNSQSGFHAGDNALTSIPMTNIGINAEADTSTSPLKDDSRTEKSDLP
ncbi:innexin unc-7 [Patella vulgata]|uniref:innexin unc-7 n=1 Tax=Patella vulgata TaxID=6465 RepID=UPI00217F2EC1|nr:innexin unc-7 [Patella vulgata]